MNGGDEGGGRKTEWSLIVQVAGFLFAVAAWANGFTDNSEADAVKLENRLTKIEAKLGMEGEGR